ncbi:MAG TPA: VOC family protein [Acidimicrobiales bacterium]|nr:VOC family protein [Acidimicrobiales bacterium]
MPNPVVHFEIMGGEGAALVDFYAGTFGWEIDAANPMNYGLVPAAEGGIGGGVGPAMDGKPFVTVYIQVDDLAKALEAVEAGGGTTLMPPTEVMPGGPNIALFNDPAGNRVGLVLARPS